MAHPRPAVCREYPRPANRDPRLADSGEVTYDSPLGCPLTPLSQLLRLGPIAPIQRSTSPVHGGKPRDRGPLAPMMSRTAVPLTESQPLAPKTAAQQQLTDQIRQDGTDRRPERDRAGVLMQPLIRCFRSSPTETLSSKTPISITSALSGLLLLARPPQ